MSIEESQFSKLTSDNHWKSLLQRQCFSTFFYWQLQQVSNCKSSRNMLQPAPQASTSAPSSSSTPSSLATYTTNRPPKKVTKAFDYKEFSLRVLRRIDPAIEDILSLASFVVAYNWENSEWVRKDNLCFFVMEKAETRC